MSDIEQAFNRFVEDVRAMMRAMYDHDCDLARRSRPWRAEKEGAEHPPEALRHVFQPREADITVDSLRVYWRVMRNTSAYCFVRKSDGAILKPAGWRGPYTRGNNYVRGNVLEGDAIDAVDVYGVKAARRG